MNQIFTGENKTILDDFQSLRIFLMEFCIVYRSVFFCSAVTYILQNSEDLPLACLFEVFTGLWLSTPTFCIKGYGSVKRFVRVLVFLVINTGCFKKIFKNGEHHFADFQFKLC